MNSHAAYEELVSLYAVGDIDRGDESLLLEHIGSGCGECRKRLDKYEAVLAALHESRAPLKPSSALHRDLMSRAAQSAAANRNRLDHTETRTDHSATLTDRFVGRNTELSLIEERLRLLARGEGSVISLEGEAGVGKSALLRMLQERAHSAGFELLEGRAVAEGRTLSCHLIVELIEAWAQLTPGQRNEAAFARLDAAIGRHLDSDAPEVTACIARMMGLPLEAADTSTLEGIEGEALERLTQQCVRRLIRAIAKRAPLVLVFDDVHWADDSSTHMIEGLLALVDSDAVMIVTSFRPGYGDTAERLRDIARTSHALRHHDVRLAPLSALEAQVLTRKILGTAEFPESLADLVRTKAGGYPLYIEEVLNALTDAGALVHHGDRVVHTGPTESSFHATLGEPIERVILSRVAYLDAAAAQVLKVAAVAGRHCRRSILDICVADDIDVDAALEQLQTRRLLERVTSRTTSSARRRTLIAEEGYVFRHGLIQEAVYGSISIEQRPDLHRACAEAIERMAADRIHDFYGALAYHYTLAARLDKATDYLLAAGEQAAGSAASAEALHFFKEAHRCYRQLHRDGGDPQVEARMEINIATALLNTGRLSECIEHFNAALRLYGHWVPRSRIGLYVRLAIDLPTVLARLYTGSIAYSATQADERVSDICHIMHNRSKAQNIVDAERNFFDNMAAIRYGAHAHFAVADHAAGFLAASGAVFTWIGFSFDVSRRFFEVAAPIVDEGPAVDRFVFQAMSFVYRFHRGEWSPRHDIAPALLEVGHRHGALWDADVYLGLCCERNIRQGNYEEAQEQIDALRRLRTEWGYEFARSNEFAQKAFLAIEQRRLPEAAEAVERYYDLRQEGTLHLLALGMRANVEILSGDLESADATLQSAAELLRRGSVTPPFFASAYQVARLRLAVTRLEAGRPVADARAIAKQAGRIASRVANVRTEIAGLSARLSAALGDRRGAERRWLSAVEQGRSLGVRPELARIYRDIGAELLRRERSGIRGGLGGRSAAQWLSESRGLFEELGAEAELAELSLLESTGAKRQVA